MTNYIAEQRLQLLNSWHKLIYSHWALWLFSAFNDGNDITMYIYIYTYIYVCTDFKYKGFTMIATEIFIVKI